MLKLTFATIEKLSKLLTDRRWIEPKKDKKIAVTEAIEKLNKQNGLLEKELEEKTGLLVQQKAALEADPKVQAIKTQLKIAKEKYQSDKLSVNRDEIKLLSNQLSEVEKQVTEMERTLKNLKKSLKLNQDSLDILQKQLEKQEKTPEFSQTSSEAAVQEAKLSSTEAVLEITKKTGLTRGEAFLLLQDIHILYAQGASIKPECVEELKRLLFREFKEICGSADVSVERSFNRLRAPITGEIIGCHEKIKPIVIMIRSCGIDLTDNYVKKLHVWFNNSPEQMEAYLKAANYSSSEAFERSFSFELPKIENLSATELKFWYKINAQLGRVGIDLFSNANGLSGIDEFNNFIRKYDTIDILSLQQKKEIKEELHRMAVAIKYKRLSENIELAEVFSSHRINEPLFDLALDFIKTHQIKDSDLLPEINFDFEVRGKKYKFQKLPAGDYRGFILGKLTACCQSLGDNSGMCVEDGMTKKNAGFYVVTDDKGKIVAQSYAWKGTYGIKSGLVFDSFESLSRDPELFVAMAVRCSQELEKKNLSLMVGTGGRTPKISGATRFIRPMSVEKLSMYGDSTIVYLINQGISTSAARFSDGANTNVYFKYFLDLACYSGTESEFGMFNTILETLTPEQVSDIVLRSFGEQEEIVLDVVLLHKNDQVLKSILSRLNPDLAFKILSYGRNGYSMPINFWICDCPNLEGFKLMLDSLTPELAFKITTKKEKCPEYTRIDGESSFSMASPEFLEVMFRKLTPQRSAEVILKENTIGENLIHGAIKLKDPALMKTMLKKLTQQQIFNAINKNIQYSRSQFIYGQEFNVRKWQTSAIDLASKNPEMLKLMFEALTPKNRARIALNEEYQQLIYDNFTILVNLLPIDLANSFCERCEGHIREANLVIIEGIKRTKALFDLIRDVPKSGIIGDEAISRIVEVVREGKIAATMKGDNLSITDRDGKTLLHLAVEASGGAIDTPYEAVKELLVKEILSGLGDDDAEVKKIINLKDSSGRTPLDYVTEENKQLKEYLVRNGARSGNDSFEMQLGNLIKVFEALEEKTFNNPAGKRLLKEKLANKFQLTLNDKPLVEQLKAKKEDQEFKEYVISQGGIENLLRDITKSSESKLSQTPSLSLWDHGLSALTEDEKMLLNQYADYKIRVGQGRYGSNEQIKAFYHKNDGKPIVILSSVSDLPDINSNDSNNDNPFNLERKFRIDHQINEKRDVFLINNHGNAHWNITLKKAEKDETLELESSGAGNSCAAYSLLSIIKNSNLLLEDPDIQIIFTNYDVGISSADSLRNLSDVNSLAASQVRSFLSHAITQHQEKLEGHGIPKKNIEQSLNRIGQEGTMLTSDDIYYTCLALNIPIIEAHSLMPQLDYEATIKDNIIKNLAGKAAEKAAERFAEAKGELEGFIGSIQTPTTLSVPNLLDKLKSPTFPDRQIQENEFNPFEIYGSFVEATAQGSRSVIQDLQSIFYKVTKQQSDLKAREQSRVSVRPNQQFKVTNGVPMISKSAKL